MVSWATRPIPSTTSVTEREVTTEFGRFARLRGLVLDVGCGPQPQPSYARGFEGARRHRSAPWGRPP